MASSSTTEAASADLENEDNWRIEFKKATNGKKGMNLLQFMQCTDCRSRFYAVKLFDTLDWKQKGVLSYNEYHSFKTLLSRGSAEELGTFAFNLFDSNRDGYIERGELREGLLASIEESEAVMEAAEINNLVEVLVRLFTDDDRQLVTRERFISVLQSYPDVLGNFTIGGRSRAAALSTTSSHKQLKPRRRKVSKLTNAWRWIEDHPLRAITNTVTVLVIISCFCWRFSRYAGDCDGVDLDFRDPDLKVTRREVKDKIEEVYGISMSDSDAKYMAFSLAMAKQDPIQCRDARKRKLLSWTLPLAKGCGQGMKVIFTLILVPVSRTLMTKLRRTFLKSVFDFDNAIAYHRMLGKIGFALAWAHATLHVVDVIRWRDPNLFKQWSFAFPEDREGDSAFDLSAVTSETEHIQGVPTELLRYRSEQPNFGDLVGSCFGVTGLVLIFTYSAAALFAFDYPKKLAFFNKRPGEKESTMTQNRKVALRIGHILNNFNYFWYTHHLFALFYLAMLFHPMPHIPNERNEWAFSDSWLWIMIPVVFYSMERLNRFFQPSTQTSVIGLRLLPGKVVEVKTARPEGMKYKAGQYVFINCHQIAPLEWHPFTLTSAPHDPYLSVHIRSAGDWTNALYTAVKGYKSYSNSVSGLSIDGERAYPFNIKVAGPYGAPAQSYEEFGVVVCIGCGIGVTPFASVLNNVLHCIRTGQTSTLRKVYFHWTVRSRKEASWFKTLLDEISADDVDGILNINIHITSLKEGNDLRVMLLRLAEFEDIDQEQGKVVSRSITHFGRPDWSKTLGDIQRDHSSESKIGVFYCGPTSLKRVLKAECMKRSRVTTPRFDFRKEVF